MLGELFPLLQESFVLPVQFFSGGSLFPDFLPDLLEQLSGLPYCLLQLPDLLLFSADLFRGVSFVLIQLLQLLLQLRGLLRDTLDILPDE